MTKPFPAKMVEAEIRHNAVNPCVKRALETESWQLQISAQEGFLIYILAIFGRTRKMDRNTKHRSVILMDKRFESRRIAVLRSSNQLGVVHSCKIGFGAWEHRNQASNTIYVAVHATSFVPLTQHVFPVRFFPARTLRNPWSVAKSSGQYRLLDADYQQRSPHRPG